MATTTKTDRYLQTFFDEKGIDMDEPFEIEGPSGVNFMSYGVVVEAISSAPKDEKDKIANALRMIDFKNGDVKHFLRHLARALAA